MPFKIFLSSFHPTFLPRILTILNRNFWGGGTKNWEFHNGGQFDSIKQF